MTGGSRATSDIGRVGNVASGAPRTDARHVLMSSGDDDWVREMRMQIAMQSAGQFRLPEPELTDAAEPGTKVVDGTQKMGASVIGYTDNQAVIAQRFDWTPARPAVPALAVARPRPSLWSAPPARAPASQDAGAPAVVQVLFTSLGKSSGEAMTMTVMTTSAEPVQFLGDGFVLEPVSGLSASDAARRLAATGGRRATVTLAAYCLDLPKAPPRAGQIFRIAPQAVQRAHAPFGRIMQASRQVRDRLRPDSDPDEYFHAIRQWAVWTTEEGFRDEAAFTRAFLDHAKKNLEGTGRRLTRDLEDAIRALLPNRWHDVQQVLEAVRR